MAHFAKIENGIVTQVIVSEQNFIDTLDGQWVQTSYNTKGGVHYVPNTTEPSQDQSKALRKNYAGINYSYDSERDAFIPPQPYPSWSLDEFSCLWNPSIPMPNDENSYIWNENIQNWERTK
jgi:hypothetical protein